MIYLDHAAATPLSKHAFEEMKPYFDADFFNPSAAYLPAQQLRHRYEAAKDQIAHIIGAKGADLVMTSGATESINLAFSTIRPGAKILISAAEHQAVRACAERSGNYSTIRIDKNARVDLADFEKQLDAETEFVSVCLVTSETGTLQPISDIAALITKERQRRALNDEKRPLYFHCDASQGLGLMEVKVARLGVDLLTLNAAKVYGPKGIGALYVGHGVKISAQSVGGGQEMGLRSGTENVPATIAFATALTDAQNHLVAEKKRLQNLKKILVKKLETIPNIEFHGNAKTQLPSFVSFSVPGVDAERVIFALEDQEIYLSTGAACAASKGIKSPTLKAMGLSDASIAGSLRISMGKLNDEENIKQAADAICEVIAFEQGRMNK